MVSSVFNVSGFTICRNSFVHPLSLGTFPQDLEALSPKIAPALGASSSSSQSAASVSAPLLSQMPATVPHAKAPAHGTAAPSRHETDSAEKTMARKGEKLLRDNAQDKNVSLASQAPTDSKSQGTKEQFVGAGRSEPKATAEAKEGKPASISTMAASTQKARGVGLEASSADLVAKSSAVPSASAAQRKTSIAPSASVKRGLATTGAATRAPSEVKKVQFAEDDDFDKWMEEHHGGSIPASSSSTVEELPPAELAPSRAEVAGPPPKKMPVNKTAEQPAMTTQAAQVPPGGLVS